MGATVYELVVGLKIEIIPCLWHISMNLNLIFIFRNIFMLALHYDTIHEQTNRYK